MLKTRRSFSTEFKLDSAGLVLDKGYSITEACEAVGTGHTAMRRWVKQLQAERGGVTPVAKAMTTDNPNENNLFEIQQHLMGT